MVQLRSMRVGKLSEDVCQCRFPWNWIKSRFYPQPDEFRFSIFDGLSRSESDSLLLPSASVSNA